MNYNYDYMVYFGRFMPLHQAHLATIEHALTLAKKVVIVLGSSNRARDIKNPWTAQERAEMILNSVSDSARVRFVPAEDYMYNDQQWVMNVQEGVDNIVNGGTVGLIGHEKDDSTYYLKMFPQWKFHDMGLIAGQVAALNSTHVRSGYFEMGIVPDNNYAPEGTRKFLTNFMKSDEYHRLVREYKHIQKYKAAWANAPYAPTFVTVDAVVIALGHVLTVRRKAAPGENLLAFSGGFLRPDEKIVDGMLRELREETKLKVPEPVLRGSIVDKETFDHPDRSLRGRTITHAFLIVLEATNQGLPKIKGGSDASKAEWIPLSQALRMGDQWFEDHLMILKHFLGEV